MIKNQFSFNGNVFLTCRSVWNEGISSFWHHSAKSVDIRLWIVQPAEVGCGSGGDSKRLARDKRLYIIYFYLQPASVPKTYSVLSIQTPLLPLGWYILILKGKMWNSNDPRRLNRKAEHPRFNWIELSTINDR